MTDEELVEAARKYEKVMLNFFVQRGVSHFDAEDMVQQVYLRLWKYSSRYRPSASLLTFLHLVAKQVMLDSIRGAVRRSQREENWAGERPESASPRRFCVGDDVAWALAKLPEAQGEVVRLGVIEERPYAEIAERLGIPVGTVKSRMSNALKELRRVFENDERP